MPLHDWAITKGWSGVHILWMTEVLRWIKPKLPAGYRAYVGTSPMVAIDDPPGEPDIAVRNTNGGIHRALETGEIDPFAPDWEGAVATIELDRSVYVERNGRLVAVVELISPGNKDSLERKGKYLFRYLGYLTNGVNMLLVDAHRKPKDYSFAEEIARKLKLPESRETPAPFAISYRVVPGDDGKDVVLAIRRTTFKQGDRLPTLPLAIGFPDVVEIDLEATYTAAAADAYLT